MPRICLLCDNLVLYRKSYSVLCNNCFKLYGKYRDTDWFRMLESTEEAQRKIDRQECYTLSYSMTVDIYGTRESFSSSRKSFWAQNIHVTNKVLELYDNSVEQEELGLGKRLTIRQLAKAVNNKLSYSSVRRALLKHNRQLNRSKRNKV